MAAGERAEVRIEKIHFTPLRSRKSRFILLLDGGTQLPRPGDQPGRHPLYKGADRRAPGESRRTLSTKLCEAWQWRQANGALRDMVCRGMLLMLDRAGQIDIAAGEVRAAQPAGHSERDRSRYGSIRRRWRAVCGDLQPLEFAQVRRSGDEPLFNSLMEEHHYLGYEQPVGEHLKYLVWAQGRPVACLAWSSAPRHIGAARSLHRLEPAKRAGATSASSPTTRGF